MFKNFFFRKFCHVWDNVEKYCTAGQTTDDKMAHAQCMLDTKGYNHTLTIRNICCYSTATMVERTRLHITSCVSLHFLSCRVMSQARESSPYHTTPKVFQVRILNVITCIIIKTLFYWIILRHSYRITKWCHYFQQNGAPLPFHTNACAFRRSGSGNEMQGPRVPTSDTFRFKPLWVHKGRDLRSSDTHSPPWNCSRSSQRR